MESSWTQASFRPRSFSRSVSPASMTHGNSKSQVPCRYFASGHCSAGSRCSFSHLASAPQVADEDSDDYPDMSHITSSMDQLAFLDDEILTPPSGASLKAASNSAGAFHTFGSFSFGNESLFAPGKKTHKSLLPSFLLEELEASGGEEKSGRTNEAPSVVFFDRPLSAAPAFSSPRSSTPVASTGFSYGDALRLGASNSSSASEMAQGYSVQPEPLVEPNFDEFEEAEPMGIISRSSTSASDELCAFSIMGKCRYGNYCRNLHGLQCPRCLLNILHPTDTERNEQHLSECFNKPESSNYSDLHQIKCGLCNESVLQKVDPRFGLLNCNHPFCLTCIRSWRATNFDANDDGSSSCPHCTEVTYFIVPSSTWIEEPVEKQKIIDQYKKKMSLIMCKYHDNGRGNCPFGSSCFYEHRNDYVPDSAAEAAKAAYRQTVTEQNERLAKVREATLSDYIVFKSVPSLGKKNKNNN